MGWEIHPAKSGFSKFAADWDQLNDRLFEGHPFFDSRFVGSLLDHFASGNELLCLHRNQGTVSGGLILQPAGWGRWTSFRPSQAQITALLLDDARLLADLLRTLPGLAWTIELIAIDPRFSPDFSCPDLISISSPQAYTIGVHSQLQFVEYWNQRPKNLRANIRRYFNRLEKEYGTLELKRITDQSEMTEGVNRFGMLESAGWKGAAGTAISGDNEQGAFYGDVLRRFSSSKQAAIYELKVADKMVASRLIIESDRMAVILKTTYDENHAHIAPGRLQLYSIIKDQLSRQPEQTIEFYTNATRDQKEWASFGCAVRNIQVFRNTSVVDAFCVLKSIHNLLRKPASPATTPEEMTSGHFPTVDLLKSNIPQLTELEPRKDIDISLGWFKLLQETVYPNDPGVRHYYGIDSNNQAAVLPVRLITHGCIKTVEALSNFYTSLYAPLQTSRSEGFILRHLLGQAANDLGRAHVMRFAPMDPTSPEYHQLLNELRIIGWIPFSFLCFGNWILEIKENWEGYLKSRSANLRSTIKRRNREFAAVGGSLEVITKAEEVEQAIAAFQEVYSASWKSPEPYPEFIPSLARHLSLIGSLRLGIAHLNGKAVAAQLWIVCGSKASIFKLAYHEAYAEYSPGTVLTGHLLRHVIEQDHVTEVDFLQGDDTHKRIWMSARRERLGIVAYNPATIVGFFLLAREALWRFAKGASHRKSVHP